MNDADRLSLGESVPGAPGACATCGHLTLWHGVNGRYRAKPCQKCDCPAFTAAAENETLPKSEPSSPRKAAARKSAPAQPGQLALFTVEEVS